MDVAGSISFLKKSNKKLLLCLGKAADATARVEVFWFFFSKKNCFLGAFGDADRMQPICTTKRRSSNRFGSILWFGLVTAGDRGCARCFGAPYGGGGLDVRYQDALRRQGMLRGRGAIHTVAETNGQAAWCAASCSVWSTPPLARACGGSSMCALILGCRI